MGMAARMLRTTGTQVMLLTVSEAAPSTDTPFSVVAANTAIDLSQAIKTPLIAHVRWHKLGQVQYGEGGRTILRKADIETADQWTSLAMQAVGVQLQDGSVMKKVGEDLSEMESTYTMTVEGYVNIQQ